MTGAPTITLNDGNKIPAIGLGTWQSKPHEVANAVEHAIKKAGYRHIDGAWAYKNEDEVGEGILASGIPRSEIFITSKLWGTFHRNVETCLDQTLKALGTDYIDLYLMHWPIPLNPKGNDPMFPTREDGSRDIDTEWDISDTWKQMEALKKAGKVKSIGVSNCSQEKLEYLMKGAEVKPAVNQLELHLYNPQHDLLAFMEKHGIVAEAYSPLGSTNSPLLKDGYVTQLAEQISVDSGAVLLGYLLAKKIVILPKSVTASRITSNYSGAIEVAGKLSSEELKKLDGVAEGGKQQRFIKPPWGVKMGFADWEYAEVQKAKGQVAGFAAPSGR